MANLYASEQHILVATYAWSNIDIKGKRLQLNNDPLEKKMMKIFLKIKNKKMVQIIEDKDESWKDKQWVNL